MNKAMINFIKSIAKRSNLLVKLYTHFNFLKQAPFRDFINIKKMTLFLKVRPYTMLTYSGLSNVYELATIAGKYKIDGCFVECGVYRGGCVAVMACVAHNAGNNRKIHLFDSFEGLPEPTEEDGNEAKLYAENKMGGRLYSIGKCVGPYDGVTYLFFSLLKLKKENIVIHKGWFQDTIPKIKNTIGHIAILRLDADWYESTKVCLDNLYDNVVSGGFIIIDDYNAWEGCKKVVDEFLAYRKIRVKMVKINLVAIYFQKP